MLPFQHLLSNSALETTDKIFAVNWATNSLETLPTILRAIVYFDLQ